MAEFNKYKQLLNDGEYASAEKILSGLSVKEVTFLPSVVSHTIYDELWHTTIWQNIVIYSEDNKALNNEVYAKWKQGEVYPKVQINTQQDWDDLVKEFLTGINKAIATGQNPETLQRKVEGQTFTIGDAIEILATHNAYHLGKIVALRQYQGCWPPKDNLAP